MDWKAFFEKNRALFLVWSTPDWGSSRSREFSKELGIRELHFIYRDTSRKNIWKTITAPYRYLYQGWKTLQILYKKRPGIVFVQSPPSFAALFVYLYCASTGSKYLIDAHSDALMRPVWNKPEWLVAYLGRHAVATIVTDEYFCSQIESRGGRVLVLKDPVTSYETKSYPVNGSFNIAVVNKFAGDEPIETVIQAAAEIPEAKFYITGKKVKADPLLISGAPKNVIFTDFLPNREYYGLLENSHAVMCLTTRDHTLQCGACEALSLNTPVITSRWPILVDYFSSGTVHVDNTREGIIAGVQEMIANYNRFQGEIRELRTQKRRAWEQKIEELVSLIQAN